MIEFLKFLIEFIRKPTQVGAISPSSKWLARKMVKNNNIKEADTIVELGPGTGVFTSEIICKAHPLSTFFAMEVNPNFTEMLKKKYPDVKVYNDSAEELLKYLSLHKKDFVDCIISGLPWAIIPSPLQEILLLRIFESLSSRGTFTTFTYIHTRFLPSAIKFRRSLHQLFGNIETSQVVWLNIPPAYVFYCRKGN